MEISRMEGMEDMENRGEWRIENKGWRRLENGGDWRMEEI